MADRLPPAPTKTALARLVRRIVDAMPWVMARDLRAARTDLARVRRLNSELREENFHLQRDYQRLFHGESSIIAPMPRDAKMCIADDPHYFGTRLSVYAEYETKQFNAIIPNYRMDRDGLSGPAAHALEKAARAVAHSHVDTHAGYLIRRVLGGRSIKDFIEAKESQNG